jgi:hypothetical protein
MLGIEREQPAMILTANVVKLVAQLRRNSQTDDGADDKTLMKWLIKTMQNR